MAKKKSVGPTARQSQPIDTASDMSTASPESAMYDPSYDEIAQVAYRRFLERGCEHGGDFDDWLEAERDLRARR
jgi:hypothetical protein